MEYTGSTLSEFRHKLKDHLGSFEPMIFNFTNRNRNRMRTMLGQGLKETAILNLSDFGLTPLHITGFLVFQVFSINHRFSDIWFLPRYPYLNILSKHN